MWIELEEIVMQTNTMKKTGGHILRGFLLSEVSFRLFEKFAGCRLMPLGADWF